VLPLRLLVVLDVLVVVVGVQVQAVQQLSGSRHLCVLDAVLIAAVVLVAVRAHRCGGGRRGRAALGGPAALARKVKLWLVQLVA
jgi:hypothetical protein